MGPIDYHHNAVTWDRRDPPDPRYVRCRWCGGQGGRHDHTCDAVALDERECPAGSCAVCQEPITNNGRPGLDYTHAHGSTACGTGDGATAMPRRCGDVNEEERAT